MSSPWLTPKDLQELINCSRATIYRRKDLRWRKKPNGQREYDPESLPAEARAKLLARSQPASPKLIPGLTAAASAAESRALITEQQRAQADFRWELAAEVKKAWDERGGPIALPDGTKFEKKTEYVKFRAHEAGVSAALLWSWMQKRKAGDYEGLARRIRSDKGRSRKFDKYPDAARFVQSKYFNEGLSFVLTHEALQAAWPRLYNHGSQPPSLGAVRAYLLSLPKPLHIYAREGERQFQEKVTPFIRRKYVDIRVNQVWISDHCQHDVWVVNDGIFQDERLGAAVRPWLTAWMDMRSRKIVGACWFATPSSHTISSALRMAIAEYGIPESVLLDNGKDYTSLHRENTLSPQASGVLARLGVGVTTCLPYWPRSKPIESWFGNRLHKRFDLKFASVGAYCGGSPARRPDKHVDAIEHHKAWLKGKASTSPLPRASEFIVLAMKFIDTYNSELPHSGQGMHDRTPDEVFNELLPPEQRRVCDQRELDALFWHRETRRVMEGGCVRLHNQDYEPADPQTGANLALLIGRDVIVSCDPADMAQALAISPTDGAVLGNLVSQKLLEQGPLSREEVQRVLRDGRHWRRMIKLYLDAISRGVETELQVARREAHIPETIEAADVAVKPIRRVLATRGSEARQVYVEDVVEDVRPLITNEG